MTAAVLAVVLAASAPQARLDAAKHRWERLHARNYTYSVTPTCGRCETTTGRIKVRNGKPVGTPPALRAYDTVPELFTRIQRAIDSHPYRVDVTYDRRGVPTMLAVDEDRSLADDVTGYMVERFRRG
jgi:Family of unknown function (DUF6174)